MNFNILKYIDTEELFNFGSFVINSKILEELKNLNIFNLWNKLEIEDYVLYIKKDNSILSFECDSEKLYIVGDIFVAHGEGEVKDIIHSFLSTQDYSKLDVLSGRYLIYYFSSTGLKILSDPFGSRTLYCHKNLPIVASHIVIIASLLGLNKSAEITEYKNLEEYNLRGTRFLPGDLTIYEEITGISPNNYFDMTSHSSCRYWPAKQKNESNSNLKDLESLVYEYFKNFCAFIKTNNYLPIFGLTAGVDTRLVIAAFKHFDTDFELLTWDRGVSNAEMEVILKIADYLDKKHYLIQTRSTLDDCTEIKTIKEIANINSGLSRGACHLTALFWHISNGNRKHVFIRGLGGEILRGMFNKDNSKFKEMSEIEYVTRVYNTNALDKYEVTDDYIALTNKYIQKYLENSNISAAVQNGYDVGDIVYWEQRMARWAAELHNEGDPAMKNLTGINSRLIFEKAYELDNATRFNRQLLIDLTKIFDEKLAQYKYI